MEEVINKVKVCFENLRYDLINYIIRREALFADSVNMKLSKEFEKKFNAISDSYNESSIMPEGIRFYQRFEDVKLFAVEQPPKVRSITIPDIKGKIIDSNMDCGSRRAKLAFPYIVFVAEFTPNIRSLYFFYNKSPLKTLNDKLYCPNLPNIGDKLRVCMGYDTEWQQLGPEQINELISMFWASKFNKDYAEWYNAYDLDFKEWEKRTIDDPFFVLKFPWHDSCVTLQRLINDIKTEKCYHANQHLFNCLLEDICFDFQQDVDSFFFDLWGIFKNKLELNSGMLEVKLKEMAEQKFLQILASKDLIQISKKEILNESFPNLYS